MLWFLILIAIWYLLSCWAAAPSVGVAAQLGMSTDTTATPHAATEAYEFLSEGLASDREIVRTEGIRGTRLHDSSRIRQGRLTPGGSISLQPTYTELANLLPRIIGVASGITYTPSDTVPVAFQVIIDRVAKVFTYTGCRVNRARFHSAVGQPLGLDLEIEALNESIGNAGTFAAGLTISSAPPFVFFDGVLTLNGNAIQVMEWETVIDWHLKADRFVNSQTRTDLSSLDFTVQTKFSVPYTSDTTALYDQSTPALEIGGNINFTYLGAGGGAAGVNLKFTYGALAFAQKKSPTVPGRDEIMQVLVSESRNIVGGAAPVVVQLDSTP